MKPYKDAGWAPIDGFQLRYIYFLDPSYRDRLMLPVVPFTAIQDMGAGMYLGKKRVGSIGTDVPGDQSGEGGVTPTPTLQVV